MKRKYYIHGIIILIMTILLAGCGAAESKKSSAKEQDVVVDVAVDPAVEWVSENIKSVEYSIPKEWECQENEDERIYYPLGKSNDKNYIKINYWRISVPTKEDNPTSTELENVFKDVIENNKVGRIKNWNEEKETYLGRPAMHASYIQRESAYEYIVDWYAAMISDKEIASFQYVRREDQKDSYKLYFEKNTDSLVMHGINGFEQAEYQKFNSYASDNGLAGTRIYIEGTIYEVVEKDWFISLKIEQSDGNRWVVGSGIIPRHKKEKFEELLNKRIKVFGVYSGFSDFYEMPFLHTIFNEECYYEDEDGKIFTERDMRSTDEEMIKWCVENDRDILIKSMENLESDNYIYSISGVVDSVLSSIKYVYLYQDTEDGIKSFSMDLSNIYSEEDAIDLSQINKGDAISICCYIFDGTPYVVCAGEAPHIKWGLEDLKKQYTDKCNKFSYKDIARNPDNVKGEYAKLAGKVIQVIEDGNSVILRVNITPTKYGFYEDTIYVEYTRKSKDEDRILEDDVITIYGVLDGTKTYTATLGQSITIPKVKAEYIDLK